MSDVRVERDSMGEVRVPVDAKWRAQTQRAVENFPISGTRLERSQIEALARIKGAVALVKRAQRAGARFRQVSVRHYPRQFGSSQFFRPGRILRTYADLARMWFVLMVLGDGRKPSDRIRR